MGASSTSSAGIWGPRCRNNWSLRPRSGLFSPIQTLSFTRTAVIPGRAANTAATLTVPCSTTIESSVCRVAAVVPSEASNTTTPYRVRPRRKAASPASKRRCSNSASGPFLPSWPTHKSTSPTILTVTTATACTSASATRNRISLINNFFKLLPYTVQCNWTTSCPHFLTPQPKQRTQSNWRHAAALGIRALRSALPTGLAPAAYQPRSGSTRLVGARARGNPDGNSPMPQKTPMVTWDWCRPPSIKKVF